MGTQQTSASSGSGERFPRTRWSLVLRSQDKENVTEAKKALSALCETYWYPLYAFARSKGCSEHDAQDRTQGFFLYLLEENLFSGADRGKGKLRNFLLTIFERYLIREYRKQEAEKRGGGHQIVSLDEQMQEGEGKYRREPFVKQDPTDVFQRAWASSLLESSHRLLEAEMAAQGKIETFKLMEPFLEPDQLRTHSYEAVSRHLGVRQDALRQIVSRLRKRYRELIRAQIADTLNNPTEDAIDEEMRFLYAAVSG